MQVNNNGKHNNSSKPKNNGGLTLIKKGPKAIDLITEIGMGWEESKELRDAFGIETQDQVVPDEMAQQLRGANSDIKDMAKEQFTEDPDSRELSSDRLALVEEFNEEMPRAALVQLVKKEIKAAAELAYQESFLTTVAVETGKMDALDKVRQEQERRRQEENTATSLAQKIAAIKLQTQRNNALKETAQSMVNGQFFDDMPWVKSSKETSAQRTKQLLSDLDGVLKND